MDSKSVSISVSTVPIPLVNLLPPQVKYDPKSKIIIGALISGSDVSSVVWSSDSISLSGSDVIGGLVQEVGSGSDVMSQLVLAPSVLPPGKCSVV